MAKRIPRKHVSKWPKKQLVDYAYRAMERESFSDDPRIAERADFALDNLQEMSREDFEWWAKRELEYRSLTK